MIPPVANPRGTISVGVRAVVFLLWTGAIIFSWLGRSLFLGSQYRPVAAALFSRWWSIGALKILQIKVTTHGKIPKHPFFLVSNHLGYLDIAVIASQVPCTFVSKAEVAGWPVFGTLATLSGTLFVDRKSTRDAGRVSRLIPDHIGAGGSLVIFAEGTSTSGLAVAPFRSPLLEFPAASHFPVHCAAILYQAPEGFPSAATSMCWWGEATFLPHFLALFRMRGMTANIAFAEEAICGEDRKSLARLLHAQVSERLGYLNGKGVPDKENSGDTPKSPAPAREAMA